MSFRPMDSPNKFNAVKLGLLINPHSRLNRKSRWETDLSAHLDGKLVARTPSVSEIPAFLERLLFVEKVNVLALCGGDGTIHHTVNALLRLREKCDDDVWPGWPCLLLLPGGTLNIIARSLHCDGSPAEILGRFFSSHRGAELASLPTTPLHLLEVESPRWGKRLGCVFGSAITVPCLKLYEERFGAGYWGLARFLGEAVRGFALKTALWHEFKYLLEGPSAKLRLDGQILPYRAAVAATVDIQLMKGWIRGMVVRQQREGRFQLRLLDDVSPQRVIRNLPRLVMGLSGPGIIDRAGVQDMELQGDFSLDGERFYLEHSEQSVSVRGAPWSIPVLEMH